MDDMQIPPSRHDNANKRFTCEYEFDGAKWSIDVWACTFEEAEMKLKAVARGRVLGVAEVIPAGACPVCGRET